VQGAVFLSASVPDPQREPEYAATADTVAIAAAVSALVYVTLGRRTLIWGGHPAITPMIWIIAEDMGIEYGAWVKLYQSSYFQDEFPDESNRFANVTYTEAVDGDRERSLRAMRERMFRENRFGAAVFIGGMGGIIEECELFRKTQPRAHLIPVASTGGASSEVANRFGYTRGPLWDEMDYVRLFHGKLGIPIDEKRFAKPDD
jgi:hypothetical protein